MHTPTGENEYISVNMSLFVIYIMYKTNPQQPHIFNPALHS